jgi:hypothetical protein
MPWLTREERDALLRHTVARAARDIPWYRERWGESWREVQGVDTLGALPLLTKDEATAHQHLLLASPSAYVGTLSSGTLHGDRPPLRVHHGAAESEAWRTWMKERGLHAPSPHTEELVLDVRAMHHGLPEAPCPPGMLRIPWTPTPNALRLLLELLSHPQPDGRRVTGLIMGSGALMAFMAWLFERGVDASTFRLRHVGTYGFRLSPHWRALVGDALGAEIYDNFSLSEFATPALQCAGCGHWHWHVPPLVAEVVDVHTGRPLDKGVGVQVLTGLYPFVQAMPLIRYWTGDLVELGPPCATAGERGFRFRGRASQCVLESGGTGDPVLVSPQDVQDFLEGRCEVARHPHAMELLGLVRSPDIGAVKFELDAPAPNHPRVSVELRFDPHVHPEPARALARELAEVLLRASAPLRRVEAEQRGTLEIHVTGPGRLTRRWSKLDG